MYIAIKNLFLASMLICLSGCCILPYPIKEELGPPIQEKMLKKIERGKTTRLEVLELLGSPDSKARRDTIMIVPPLRPRKEDSLDVKSQDLLDLFSAKNVITEKHIIYYYESSTLYGVGVVVVGVAAGDGVHKLPPQKLRVSRLWILIDTETGHVVDYIFRRDWKKNRRALAEAKAADDTSVGWTPIQIAIRNPVQLPVSEEKDVKGIRLNLFYSKNRAVWGLDLGVGHNTAKEMRGIQVAGFFNSVEKVSGIQVGLMNNTEKISGIQVAGFFNSAEKVSGIQVAGLVNIAHEIKGLQIGLYNHANVMTGVQIGIINIIIESKIPFLPIVNAKF